MFYDDLKVGQTGEKRFAKYLDSKGYTDIKFNDNSEYDLEARLLDKIHTFEVKTEKFNVNLAYEIACLRRVEPTGLLISKADFYVNIMQDDKAYLIDKHTLKQIISRWDFRKRGAVKNGGDGRNAVLVLLPIDHILKFYQQFYKIIPL